VANLDRDVSRVIRDLKLQGKEQARQSHGKYVELTLTDGRCFLIGAVPTEKKQSCLDSRNNWARIA